MRFALLGNHPDGLAFARALNRTGRHDIGLVTTPLSDDDRAAFNANLVADLEEVLADPSVEAVIVAGALSNRPVQLRRSLQSERHVVCVHPADLNPDVAYEANLIRQDTGMALLPLLPAALHPGVKKLQEWLRSGPGPVKLIELEILSRQLTVSITDPAAKGRAALPGWDILRRVGGEVAEVTGFAERTELSAEGPLFVSGSFQQGGQFQLALRPSQSETRWRVTVTKENGRAELTLADDLNGWAKLTWSAEDDKGEANWDAVDPWGRTVEMFEQHVTRPPGERSGAGAPLSWQDEVRCLELDDAVIRSVEKRRAVTLEYPEATEEAGFKGTMTLLGCGMLWLIVLLLILSVWVPSAGWFILPVLAVFLGLQSFLWVARRPATKGRRKP